MGRKLIVQSKGIAAKDLKDRLDRIDLETISKGKDKLVQEIYIYKKWKEIR